jgi:hypothetical protein
MGTAARFAAQEMSLAFNVSKQTPKLLGHKANFANQNFIPVLSLAAA